MALNASAIKQWLEDLRDEEFGLRFNADKMFYEYTGKGTRRKLEGDASLFLAYRCLDVIDDHEVISYLENIPVHPEGYHPAEVLVHELSGIPLKDAKALMWMEPLLKADYDTTTLKATQFADVLEKYQITGEVDWTSVLPSVRTTAVN
jgi:hypothetical protein